MNLKYGQLDILEQELETLLPMHRIAFAAACCERLFPNYGIFLREIKEQGWNEQDPIREALDEIWGFLAGKKVDVSRFRQLLFNCERYFYDSENEETPEGQRGAWIVCNTIELCLAQTPQQTFLVAKEIDETLFEYIDYLRCQSEDESSEDISHEQLLEIVANHPFTVREMAKQSEDLQRLREIPTLTPEFLQWLRTSSENGGKSLLDLS
ncbi:DUF416 family protein [Dendronalium sp. ChiSLP03b]|uniref:DUF416 family protein n=1 Tax=Dendronalium sp. ChiSLP03b TaxID=3075381 RepID=UPI002AD30E8D|nr:DUF416 family protein [Dendronalium sp. ChiSLP03b]MDZ8204428.1 DUF416 family protein [Dendronalium sp. ChiSLP03b]